jgi:hypothetical protein
MTQGLLKKLALAAPFVVCLPLCAFGADGAIAETDDNPRIFEEFSLTSATVEAPTPANAPAPLAPPPGMANAQGNYGSVNGCGQTNCCQNNCCQNNCCNTCCGDPCGSGCQHSTGILDNCGHGLHDFFSIGDGCCPQFFTGVEATLLWANVHGMHADAAVEDTLTGNTQELSNGEGFDRFTFSPRIWAGVQDGCWAFLGRFWYMSDSFGGLDPVFPPPGQTVGTFDSVRLKAYTVDLEARRSFCCGQSKVDFFLGGRYGSFEAGQGLDVTRLTGLTDVAYSNAFTDFHFNGVGITTGFWGRTPIGCDTCISLVWGVRGSVLWGDAYRAAQTTDTSYDGGISTATGFNSAESDQCATAFIVEAQFGAQWDHELRCLPMSAFFRIYGEYQYWDLGGSGSVAVDTAALNAPSFAHSSASIGNVDMNLVGLTIGCGFNW